MSRASVSRALLALAMFCAIAMTPRALADSQTRIVRLSYASGDVQIDRRTGQGYEKAILNMPVIQGTCLWTRADGRAEIEFEDGATIRLVPESRLEFQELGLLSNGGKTTTVEVQEGTMYFDVHPKSEDNFRLALPGRDITLTHSARFRIALGPSALELAVFKGEVDIQGPTQVAKIKKDETITLDLQDPARYTLAKGIQQISTDDWNQEREEYRQQYASGQSYRNGLPYSYGVTDLNYWGNYFHVPSQGWMWRPNYVSNSWNPFIDGAWSWFPGGYVWVSTYPWGWLPYRYGSWSFINGYGWCWSPGPRTTWTFWNPVPRIQNAPRTIIPPIPPAGQGTVLVGNGGGLSPGRTGGGGRLFEDEDLLHRHGRFVNQGGVRGGAPANAGTGGAAVITPGGVPAPQPQNRRPTFGDRGRDREPRGFEGRHISPRSSPASPAPAPAVRSTMPSIGAGGGGGGRSAPAASSGGRSERGGKSPR